MGQERVALHLVLLQLPLDAVEIGLAEAPAARIPEVVRGDDQMHMRTGGIEMRLGVGERIGGAERQVLAREVLQNRRSHAVPVEIGETENLMVEDIPISSRREKAGILQKLAMNARKIIPRNPEVLEQGGAFLLGLVQVVQELSEADRFSGHRFHHHALGRRERSRSSSSRSRSSSAWTSFRADRRSPPVVRWRVFAFAAS